MIRACHSHFDVANIVSGTFIVNHYKDAIGTIRSLEQDLDLIKKQLQMSDEDLIGIFEEEKQYIENLLQPPIDVQLKGEYVRALKDWTAAMCVLSV